MQPSMLAMCSGQEPDRTPNARRNPPKQSPLTQEEVDERGFVREKGEPRDIEAVSQSGDGSVSIWNRRGEPVDLQVTDHESIVALLLQGHIDNSHIHAIADAVEQELTPESRQVLMELYSELLHYAPPDGFDGVRARYESLQSAQRNQGHALPSSATGFQSSLLWTVNPDLIITSATGDAADWIFEEVRQQRDIVSDRPLSLFDYYGTTDPNFEPIAAHLAALQGERRAYVRRTPDGHEWHAVLTPARRNGTIIGVVGYKVDHGVASRNVVPVVEEAYCVVSPEGNVIQYSRPFKRLFRLNATTNLVGRHILRPALVRQASDTIRFVESTNEILHSKAPVNDYVELADGRVLFRCAHPVTNPDGSVRTWAMYWTEVRRNDLGSPTTRPASARRD